MRSHFCKVEKTQINYEGECNWCGEKEMNAYELADIIANPNRATYPYHQDIAVMLRQQADRIAKLEQALQSIANERIELSHDKIKWQCEDHIKWAKETLK